MKKINQYIFFLLILFILLYRLQFSLTIITAYFVREALYLYLYFCVVFFYRKKINWNLLLIILFLIYSVLVGLHTYFLYGFEMAYSGFTRFIGVALLAPLVAIMFSEFKQVKILINIWLTVVFLGAFSVIYLFFGGDLIWLIGPYSASRAGLRRFGTLLGQANVGGIAATIAMCFSTFSIKNTTWSIMLITAAFFLAILSISKAAYLGFLIFIIFVSVKNFKTKFNKKNVIRLFKVSTIVLLIFVVMYFFSYQIRIGITNYVMASMKAIQGTGEGGRLIQGAMDQIYYRIIDKPMFGVKIMKHESSLYLLNFFVGSSFGVAGSAATSILSVPYTTLPHNSLLEIFMVGGVIFLAIFLLIIIMTFKRLILMSRKNIYYYGVLWAFIFLCLFLNTFTVIYDPVLGGLFWSIIGLAANKRVIS